jgi:hypothetical protein
MRKRPATATSADFNFVKAYFELKKLREDSASKDHRDRPQAKRW